MNMTNNQQTHLTSANLIQSIFICLFLGLHSPMQAQVLNSASLSKGTVPINEDFTVTVQLTPNNNMVWCGLRVEYGDGRIQDIRVGSDGYQSLPLKLTHRYSGSGNYDIRTYGRYMSRGLRSANACEGAPISLPVKVIDPAAAEAARRLEDQVIREANERNNRIRQNEERLERERQLLEAQRKAIEEREQQAKERELAERERVLREREAALNRKTQEPTPPKPAAPPTAPVAKPAPAAKPAVTGF